MCQNVVRSGVLVASTGTNVEPTDTLLQANVCVCVCVATSKHAQCVRWGGAYDSHRQSNRAAAAGGTQVRKRTHTIITLKLQ